MLPIAEKIKILDRLKLGESATMGSRIFGIHQSTGPLIQFKAKRVFDHFPSLELIIDEIVRNEKLPPDFPKNFEI